MNFRRLLLPLLVLILLTGGIGYWILTSQPPSLTEASPNTTKPAQVGTNQDKTRKLLIGVWRNESKAKRTMTLNQDGTGTILAELSGLQATLVGPQLRFDIRWSLKDGSLTKHVLGGEPADKVNFILNTKGNTAKERILQLTEENLLLLGKDGKTKLDWRRVATQSRKP